MSPLTTMGGLLFAAGLILVALSYFIRTDMFVIGGIAALIGLFIVIMNSMNGGK